MAKILIVDDNVQISSILCEYAKNEGYEIEIAHDGAKALEVFESDKFDLILLDVMLPKIDGFEVCREIRKKSNVPVIMITARGEDFEKIMGLDIGADDYIVKPFSPSEVMARIRAILRRFNYLNEEINNVFIQGSLKIDIDSYQVLINDTPLNLTKKEVEILWTFATNSRKVFSRENLLNSVWGYEYYGDNRTVDSHIKRLRAKIDEYDHPDWQIKTIWGVGYKYENK